MIKSKPLYGEVIGEVRSGRVIFSDQFMRFLDEIIDQYGFIPWDNLNFTGSNLTDIETRLHNDLQAIGGADDTDTDDEQVQHISNLQAKTWTDNDAKQVDVTDTDAVRDKHVSNALGKLWTDTASDLLGHTADTSAHGVTGDNVGTQDFATLGTGGVVLLAAPVADADARQSASTPIRSTAPRRSTTKRGARMCRRSPMSARPTSTTWSATSTPYATS